MRGPGIEPGSTAWKAAMLTITPATLAVSCFQFLGSAKKTLYWGSLLLLKEGSFLSVHHHKFTFPRDMRLAPANSNPGVTRAKTTNEENK